MSFRSIERWHECVICLCPRLRMVWGLCQHRICETCLYDGESERIKPIFESCPICGAMDAFPKRKPIVPAESIDIQRRLGVIKCPECEIEMWKWELDDHVRSCRQRRRYSRKRRSASKKTSSSSSSSPQVETPRRSARLARSVKQD